MLINFDQVSCSPLFFGAILAGGRSSRMGCDKRFLKINSEYLVDRALRMVVNIVGADHTVLCGNVPDRNCVHDSIVGIGPMAGILAAVQVVRARQGARDAWLLVLPVDMPQLTEKLLYQLFLSIPKIPEKSPSIIAYENFEMPFILRCDSKLEAKILEICKFDVASQRSIRWLLGSSDVLRVMLDPEDKRLMINANSPVEWEEVCSVKVL